MFTFFPDPEFSILIDFFVALLMMVLL